MKVLLMNPPVEDFFYTPQRAYPLGLLSLGAVLRQGGMTVEILNCLEDYTKKSQSLPPCLAYLKRYYKPNLSPFRLFSHFYRFGLDEASIIARVKDFSPQVVGISCNFSAYLDSSFRIARLIKAIDRRIYVVAGGRAATCQPDTVLKNAGIDFVLKGEAEYSLLKLCEYLKNGVKKKIEGLCYKRGDGGIRIASGNALIRNIDALPEIDRTMIDYKKYRYKGYISTAILASRGCGLKCDFCAITDPFRYRSADHVLREMEQCFSLGIRHFNFEDDNMNLNPEFEKILDMIIERFGSEIKISFMNGLLSLKLLGGLKDKLLKAGLTHLDLSMASSSRSLRKKIGRRESLKDLTSVAVFMAGQTIVPTIHYIVGFPGQKFTQSLRDIRFLAAKPVMLGPSIFYPAVESKMFEELKRDFSFTKEDYMFFRSSAASFDKDIERNRIFLIFYASRIVNFIKELCDQYVLSDTYLSIVLNRYSRVFIIRNDCIIFREKPDRFLMGCVLLKLLLKEYRLYRIEKKSREDNFLYHIKKEDFIEPVVLKRLFSGLTVRGISGKKVLIK